MNRSFLCAAMVAATIAGPAVAANVTVQVRDASGAVVPNAVVTIELTGRPTPPAKGGGSFTVEQREIQFQPFVTIVPKGSSVAFPNRDKVRHHVYSFSPAKKFELKLYAREDNRAVRFDQAGIVALGCNIHDRMSAYVAVVDTPWAAKTDANGVVRLNNVPGGAMSVTVWHPALRTPGNRTTKAIRVADAANHSEGFAVALRPGGRMQ